MAGNLDNQPQNGLGSQPTAKPSRTVKIGRQAQSGRPPAPAETLIELTLTAMAPTGEAIGRHEGMVLFVPFGLPGEVVRVRVVERKRNFGRAEIVAVLTASPQRVEPRCPYFGRCGGCDWQHIAYAAQVKFKTEIVREQLARIGKLPDADVRPCISSPTDYEYRNHARMGLLANGHVGYRMARSHRLIAVDECPILLPDLQAMLADEFIVDEPEADGEPDEAQLQAWDEAIELGGFAFQVSPGNFFQANTAVAELLLAAVLAELPKTPRARVLDLYCGVGLFTVPAAAAGATVTGVEVNLDAVDDAFANLERAGVEGTLLATNVQSALLEPEVAETRWDAVILDPPREGVEAEALALLADLDTPLLLYVSCEPATLARDVRALAEQGWRLDWAQPFDMFPQTRHVETLAVLRR